VLDIGGGVRVSEHSACILQPRHCGRHRRGCSTNPTTISRSAPWNPARRPRSSWSSADTSVARPPSSPTSAIGRVARHPASCESSASRSDRVPPIPRRPNCTGTWRMWRDGSIVEDLPLTWSRSLASSSVWHGEERGSSIDGGLADW